MANERRFIVTVLLLETIDDTALKILCAESRVIMFPSLDNPSFDVPWNHITAIITRGLGQLDSKMMAKCPNLKVIARCGAGLDNLDTAYAEARKIPVIFAPGFSATAVAEHAVMLMLMTVRQGFAMANAIKLNDWFARQSFTGQDLAGKTVCIVGNGAIGRQTAKLCKGFGMSVRICRREGGGIRELKNQMRRHLPHSHVVSMHVPFVPETEQILDRDMIDLCPQGVTVTNTARSGVVCETAVLEALNSGDIGWYGADVPRQQPSRPDDPLLHHARSVVTPHVAAMTETTYQAMCTFTVENVLTILRGETPDPRALFKDAASCVRN